MTTIGTTPLRRVLVANRAEIASRVFRTCRTLGIETVAIHSDADSLLPYVREADVAVRLPGHAPADTYLRADLVVDAARRTGADAIHPGYGFLSENADFARAVIAAGITWVGPTPESIDAMGSKIEAKRIMKAAGVPVLEAPEQPTEADLPLLVKASAGGGGRGIAGEPDADVGLADVRQAGIGVGVHRHGLDAERAAGPEDARGDLGPVGDQKPVDHGRNTPNRSVPVKALVAITDRQMPRTVRVSRGSMTPSS